jgi:2-aminoadipate transaminase
MRLGFIVGDREYVDKLTIVKQATDLCTSPFTQGILCEMIKGGALETHIKKLVSVYQEKRKYMLKTLDKYMNQLEGVSWTRPYGGLFLWMRLPYYMDTEKMLKKALKKKVAYVAGVVFHFDGSGKNTLRLNFSYPSIKEIDEGIKRLSEVISEEIR